MTPWHISAATFSGRAVRRFVRSPEAIVNTVIFPLLLLFAIFAAFATSVEAFEGDNYAQRLVPGLVVSGLMFGSVGAAVGLQKDIQTGFMARIRTMPVRPSTTIVGVVAAEVVRAAAALLVLGSVGYALGFRFEGGALRTLLIFPVAVLIGIAMTMPGLAFATMTKTTEALSAPLGALYLVLMFMSAAMVPIEAYPDWAQPIVRASPVAAFVRVLDRLGRGGDLGRPVLWAILWAAVLIIGFGALAVRRLAGPAPSAT
ncbi:MAG: ABC transporter permease [Actinomycetota bacterium]